MFVGREKELAELKRVYQSPAPRISLLYGKPHIGKSALLRQFAKGRRTVRLFVPEMNDKLINSLLFESFSEQTERTGISSMEELTQAAIEYALSGGQILILEEPQRLYNVCRDAFPAWLALIQKGAEAGLHVILSSGDDSFVRSVLLAEDFPLKFESVTELTEFTYTEAYPFLNGYSYEDALLLYFCVGGSPYYLSEIDTGRSAISNIERIFLKDHGRIYESPSYTLMREIREQTVYNSILYAVANGADRYNEISEWTGCDSKKATKYINMLVSLGVLKRITPFGDDPEKSRKGIYVFTENGWRFWYRYVLNGKSIAQVDSDDPFFEQPFEQICTQYLMRKNDAGELPFEAAAVGRWWGSTGRDRQPEVDIVVSDRDGKNQILCECKWAGTPATVEELDALRNKKGLAGKTENTTYLFFSRPGFTAEATEQAKEEKEFSLLELADLF